MIDIYFNKVNLNVYRAMREWCMNTIGEEGWYYQDLDDAEKKRYWFSESKGRYWNSISGGSISGGTSMSGEALFSFTNPDDATMFKLKFV